jgi:hypothetical protein
MTQVTIGSIILGAMCSALFLWVIKLLKASKNFIKKEVKQ